MAYMFNDDKTKFPFARDLLWSGNESESTLSTWEFLGADHGINLSDYDEFEIHTQEGSILIFKEVGTLLTNYSETAFVGRYVTASRDLNYASAAKCYNIKNGIEFSEKLIPTRFYGIKIGET